MPLGVALTLTAVLVLALAVATALSLPFVDSELEARRIRVVKTLLALAFLLILSGVWAEVSW